MDEEKFNMSIRKFLKVVGVTSQREVDKAVRRAIESGHLHGNEKLKAKMTLRIDAIDLTHETDGEIGLG